MCTKHSGYINGIVINLQLGKLKKLIKQEKITSGSCKKLESCLAVKMIKAFKAEGTINTNF